MAVSRTGGAAGLKQFENVAAPSDAVQRGTPINLKLLYSNRVQPARSPWLDPLFLLDKS